MTTADLSNSGPIAPAQRHNRKCSAHKTNGEPCGRWAVVGGLVCPRTEAEHRKSKGLREFDLKWP